LPGTLQQFLDPAQMQDIRSFEPCSAAIARIQAAYGLSDDVFDKDLDGIMGHLQFSFATLVTTIEELQDPVTATLADFYQSRGVEFVSVGPLLGPGGAKRVAGHRTSAEVDAVPARDESRHAASQEPEDVVELVRRAWSAGRKVVLASMGTVIIGDLPEIGWEGRPNNAEGQPHGLTGRELCRSVWGAAFDAFGAQSSAEEGPLLVVSLGPQPNALGELVAPPNAMCLPVVPQVDVLKEGADAFLTHGGQNSFTESLAFGAPVLVCPGFGDHPLNAQKAVSLGVGMKVDRPKPAIGEEAVVGQQYREEVGRKLRELVSSPSFKERATFFRDRLQNAGGLARAVEVILAAAGSRRGDGGA